MKVVDANMYWFDETIFKDEKRIEQFLAEIPKVYQTNGYMKTNEQHLKQIVIEKPTGSPSLDYVENDYLLPTMLKDMDLADVEKAVLKTPGCQEWMSLDICKQFNDGMARYMKESQGRLRGLCVVPPFGTPSVFAEIDRCFDELGFTGVQVIAHYGERYLDDAIFDSFFSYLNARFATIYVHHTPVPVDYSSIKDFNNLRRSYGRCVDQTTAIGRELFSDFFERFPNIKMIHSMLGGGFFAVKSLLFPNKGKNDGANRFKTDNSVAEKALTENIFFEMSHAQPWGKEQLECAVKVLGADHILFGTSYPVRKEWLTEGVQFVKELNITEEEKELILSKNAERLYKL
jgi:predicted TIM-barrel fold metal-dependent hydrolase